MLVLVFNLVATYKKRFQLLLAPNGVMKARAKLRISLPVKLTMLFVFKAVITLGTQ